MEGIDFTKKAEILAVCEEIKALGEIREGRDVSVIHLRQAPEIINFSEPNGEGTAHGVDGDKILWTHTWDKIRELQTAKGVDYPDTVTAQAILTGSEEMIVFVKEYTGEKERHGERWISMEVFLCEPHSTFDNYADVCVWTKRLEVRNKLKRFFS